MAKVARVGSGTAKLHLDWLHENGFLDVKRMANLRLFRADYSRKVFSRFKIAFNVAEIERSGLAEHLLKELHSQRSDVVSMVLLGPFSRGENDRRSKMDILIICKSRKPKINARKSGKLVNAELNVQCFTLKLWKETAGKDRAFYDRVISDGIPLFGKMPLLNDVALE